MIKTADVYKDERSHKYEEFLEALKRNFNEVLKTNSKLFTTNVDGLFDKFLNGLPEEHKHIYICRACSQFVERFGGLVVIGADGSTRSALWDLEVPEFFRSSIEAMRSSVERARVTGVFISDTKVLGQPITGEWHHMSVTLHREMVFNSRFKTADQMMAEKKEEFAMLGRALREFPIEATEQAVNILQSETLYRGERFLGNAKWFMDIHTKRANCKTSTMMQNVTWLAIAEAPTGFCHIKSSMIGSLLEDLICGMTFDRVKARFDEKMNPSTYMRSQSAPSANAVYEAEKLVEKMGIAESLQRRYATIEEITSFVWKAKAHGNAPASNVKGVFGNVTPKDKHTTPELSLPTTVMTWDKFQRTVLPTADGVEAKVENANRLMALVTAQDGSAPNILQWNNTFSWYYHGGADGEIKSRVEDAGGRYEDNEIRCSLIWEGYTDLDLHCVTPKGEHIYYGADKGRCGGYLDTDANAGSRRTEKPVENLRWAKNAPEGKYKFYVNNYVERGNGATPYRVELEVNGQVYTFDGSALIRNQSETAFEFIYEKGKQPIIAGATQSTNDWNLTANDFVKVNAITTSPNLWDGDQYAHAGHHMFFLLDGCKDMSEGKGRGFFNEMLKPELRQIKKTLEAFTANTPIANKDQSTACGLGYSKDSEWNVILKVTSNGSTRLIKIDRFD